MTKLTGRFALAVVAVALLCVAIAVFLHRKPAPETLRAMSVEAADVVQKLESRLATTAVENWWQSVDESVDKNRYVVEFGDLANFQKPTVAVLETGKTDAAVDGDGFPFAQRLVNKTDQVVIVSFSRNVLDSGLKPGPRTLVPTIVGLLAIPALFGWLMLRPLSRRLRTLQHAATGFAGGNFSTRVPVQEGHVADEIGSSFNSMAEHIESLVDRNSVLLDEQREMLRAVAHEFRGPLARIRFALDMTEDAGGQLSSELNQDMGNGLDELDLLVGEVLSYSRLQPGTPTLNFESVHFDEIVGDAVNQCQLGTDSVNITTRSDAGGDTLIEVDAYYLQRAILNLLTNAARHSNGEILITWGSNGDECHIHVDDNGVGVPASWRSKIFDPFVRVDPSRSRHSGGVGLGLAIVGRIVAKHGGQITVDEAPVLGGARFSMSWPVSPPHS